MKTLHTPEPWKIEPATKKNSWRIVGANGQVVSVFAGSMDMDNARRIVACVNACAGITVEMLEAMPSGPASLLPMYARLEQQRDRAERALRAAGFTYAEGAEEWRPPLGPSASPLLDKIDKLQSQRDQLLAALDAIIELHDSARRGSDVAATIANARAAIAAVKGE